MKRLSFSKAFTLLEVVLAVSLWSVILSLLCHFFFLGKKAKERLAFQDSHFEDNERAFEIFGKDLERMLFWQNRWIQDGGHGLEFVARGGQGGLCRIHYRRTENAEVGFSFCLERIETPFGEEKEKNSGFLLVKEAMDVAWEWLEAGGKEKTSNWKKEWASPNRPLACRLHFLKKEGPPAVKSFWLGEGHAE